MTLFHATFKTYQSGDIITINPKQNYHTRAADKGYQWVEEVLENHKPSTAPPRTDSVYAFEALAHCKAYIEAIKDERTPKYYEVAMVNYWKAPMVLVNRIQQQSANDTIGVLSTLANEYWQPQSKWNVMEYFGLEMTVIKEVTAPLGISGTMAYQADYFKAKDKNWEVEK